MSAKQAERELSEQEWEDILDSNYGDVEICGMTFSSGRALRELDPTAFRCGKSDYEDGLEPLWECSECDRQYDNEDEAEECCKDSMTDDERRGV